MLSLSSAFINRLFYASFLPISSLFLFPSFPFPLPCHLFHQIHHIHIQYNMLSSNIPFRFLSLFCLFFHLFTSPHPPLLFFLLVLPLITYTNLLPHFSQIRTDLDGVTHLAIGFPVPAGLAGKNRIRSLPEKIYVF